METRLDYNYLDKLTEKYRDFPTVLFLAGAFHMYKIDEPNSLYKYGYESINQKQEFSASRGEMYVVGTLILLAAILIYIVFNFSITSVPMNVNLSGNLSGNLSKPLSGNLNAPLSVDLSVPPFIQFLIVLAAVFMVCFTVLYVLFSEHPIYCVQKYLMDKNIDEEVIEHIIFDLNNINYFDEEE